MKFIGIVLFFSVFFSVYLLGNYYVYIRGIQALPSINWLKILYRVVFAILAFSFIISRFTSHSSLFSVNHVLTWIGSFWLVTIVYFLIILLFVDLTRLSNLAFHFLPVSGTDAYNQLKLKALIVSVFAVVTIIAYGHYNATHARIVNMKLAINKPFLNKGLKIVAASDIHLGPLVGKDRLEEFVRIVNNENPDIILLAGDLLDESQEPILHEHTGEPLKKLKAKYGVYAVAGNHEYIGGITRALQYLESLNIRVLKDNLTLINNEFYLVGRDDYGMSKGMGMDKKRCSLKELVSGVDFSKPVILLDHQPYNLNEARENGIDLQLSGHTHNGQFWPFNYLTKSIFEVSWGYKKKGNTHYYISSGYGSWGPPVRIGNKPEVVVIELVGGVGSKE
jgi:predicted MPP superfamily phosphohydrolase